MLRFPHPFAPDRPKRARCPEKSKDPGERLALPACREKLKKLDPVAVVGGGFAELMGSFHTKWLELAREFGLAMISRMDPDLYEQECLDVRLRLEKDKFVSM